MHELEVRGLDELQAGHLRHFANLARQPDNDWSGMHGRGTGQDDFGAYRFQIAYMAYALALAHRHRLPAAPGLFKPVFERLIHKMLLPEVWMYWPRVSRGGSVFNMHLSERYEEQWDPVGKDNVMYSAYVQSMALLYNHLFDDGRYAAEGALTFRYWSFFWGGTERRFVYDQNSLNQHLYWQMVESGFVGVACEPNCVFQICNQPAILGFRMHDLVNGGSLASEVTAGYQHAWERFGRLGANGHYNMMLQQDSGIVRDNAGPSPWADAWCGTLMNMWNREFVHQHYPAQSAAWLVREHDAMMCVRSAQRLEIMGQAVVNDDSDFGWAATWASEMGDSETLDGLLRHAERFMRPTWRDGGFYYPRNDVSEDSQGYRTLVEAMTGNALLGYARLNVPDGLWGLYNQPWDQRHHLDPALTQVGNDVDILQAFVDRDECRLYARLQRSRSAGDSYNVEIGRLAGVGHWQLSCDNSLLARGEDLRIQNGGSLDLRATGQGIALTCPAGAPVALTLDFGQRASS
ncbi:hypothetical protein [Variovorax sp. OV329]|uniref:linalool dehydratase/isomerase domain-containing protein n=1 Tax=Variovorax sp. OV329 TaxID=1882825 RepID=UPI0008EE7C8C|nr:hypothetical protein [Variovorax sp. OV329]SFM93897.1 hypothetical protein SAMN05444747_111135 [Variovorax sp. OV329]